MISVQYLLLIVCYPSSLIGVLLFVNLFFSMCIAFPPLTSCFIPSTSFCSLCSWFTVVYFILHTSPHHSPCLRSHYSVTPSVFHSGLKTHLYCKSFPPYSFWFHFDCLHGIWTRCGLAAHWRFCFSFLLHCLFYSYV